MKSGMMRGVSSLDENNFVMFYATAVGIKSGLHVGWLWPYERGGGGGVVLLYFKLFYPHKFCDTSFIKNFQ